MAAFFIAMTKVKDPEKFQEYARRSGETFKDYGGEPVMRGKAKETLAGNVGSAHDTVGIVKFPDFEALTAWFNSDAYQALVALRDEASDMTIASYEIPE